MRMKMRNSNRLHNVIDGIMSVFSVWIIDFYFYFILFNLIGFGFWKIARAED